MTSFVMKIFMLVLFSTAVSAHEMTPTYFEIKNSLYDGVYETKMTLFNRREDISYYEVKVLDAEMKPIPFASENRILNVPAFKKANITVFIKRRDLDRAVYICTQSKTLKGETESTGVTSRICSKRK